MSERKNGEGIKGADPYALVNCEELLNAATTMMVAIMTAMNIRPDQYS